MRQAKRSRARKSYEAFKRNITVWKSKGYHIEADAELLTFAQYKRIYRNARRAGKKNIARELASAARSWTKSELKSIEQKLENYTPDFRLKFDFNKKEILKEYSRAKLFNMLIDNGYSYKEADRIFYGQ